MWERLILRTGNWEVDANTQALEDWLVSRKNGGRALRAVRFLSCADSVRPSYFRVVNNQLAQIVEWNPEE